MPAEAPTLIGVDCAGASEAVTVVGVRDLAGWKFVHELPKGAVIATHNNRIVVAGADFPAYYLNMDGTTEVIS